MRQRRTVDFDEGLVRAPRVEVYEASQHFLSDSRFTEN